MAAFDGSACRKRPMENLGQICRTVQRNGACFLFTTRSRIANIADLAGQVEAREWLGQKWHVATESGRPAVFALAVARDIEDLELGVHGLELPGQLPPVHPRHDDVGDEQIEPLRMRAEK